MTHPDREKKDPTRRDFIKGTAAGIIGTALSGALTPLASHAASGRQDDALQPVSALPGNITRTWLGPSYWGNRLQDWRLHRGRLECLRGEKSYEVRSVGVLTREVRRGQAPARLRVLTGLLSGGEGFAGFLIGVGGGALDWRAAALAQRASGEGGGLLCTFETDGQVRFRDHTSEEEPHAFSEIKAEKWSDISGHVQPVQGRGFVLDLEMLPQEDGTFDLVLTARGEVDGPVVAGARRRGVKEEEIVGGISLVSSPPSGRQGARWWFQDLKTGGEKIAEHPERATGPILGTLYSLNETVLKMSAQLMPVGDAEPQEARLEVRPAGSTGPWQERAMAQIAPGYTALFRVEDWDASKDWAYRVVYTGASGEPAYYAGRIRRDPKDAAHLKVGLFSCSIASARSLEGGAGRPELPGAELLGRYTHKNIYFPHDTLVRNAGKHEADLLVFAGDQFYEGNPTRLENREDPGLDYLYKWYLWVWSFRDLTRSAPAILMVDDHDVYHPNVWGNGGRQAPEDGWNHGGYIGSADFVNMVQRTQCSHNPDPYDPTPVDRGITVYYGAFRYGGVNFAVLEDRKFKTAPIQGQDLDVHESELLGPRQEQFLADWAREGGTAKICLTQTCFACVQTSPNGRPLVDFDSNGYPKYGRDRAVELLREAGALVLAGDQHLATVVRHGVDRYDDGIVQFSGPACGSSWQRWFEPAEPLPNSRDLPHTGDFKDAFGNKVRVLSVANPKISFKEYREHKKGRSQGLGDRRLKSEGYGIVHVNREARTFTLECWPWDENPDAAGARQFAGWPLEVPFSEVAGV